METSQPATLGIHHVGLTVSDLTLARSFFVDGLGFRLVGERPEYPAAFVSDGTNTITLWRAADPAGAIGFDRRWNIGLHHLAFRVECDRLLALYERLKAWPGVIIDSAPSRVRPGADSSHFLLFMPGGPRLEFVCSPALAEEALPERLP